MDSILTSIKKLLGIPEEYEVFDNDIILYINSALSILTQIGVGPEEGFRIEDETATWDDYIYNDTRLESVKEFIYLKVKMIFDPPTSNAVLTAMQSMLNELTWRLNVATDPIVGEEEEY